jgi:glycine C-acetyltransferase/8-amino-7-oxononanoate synthase
LTAVEDRLRVYFGEPDAAYFGSGYLSSLILAQGLTDRFEAIFVDEQAHFCLGDAASSVQKPVFFFGHCDPQNLVKQLKQNLKPRQRPLVLTDGVFPVFGRIAPVPEYAEVLGPYDGLIALDDAHGVGVLGERGRGVIDHFRLKRGTAHLAGTLSKAFGGHGGFIVGGRRLISHVRACVGAYVGSTPTPTPVAAASAKGIEILMTHPEMRKRLWENVALAKAALRKIGVQADDSPVPIVAWSLRSAAAMKKVQRALLGRGIAIAYLKYKGAPAAGVLRITIFSTHSAGQISQLVNELSRAL